MIFQRGNKGASVMTHYINNQIQIFEKKNQPENTAFNSQSLF